MRPTKSVLEAAAFAFDGAVEGAGVEHDALGEAFDHGEAVVGGGLLHHSEKVLELGGEAAGDEGGTTEIKAQSPTIS